jgi:hypothetical protein
MNATIKIEISPRNAVPEKGRAEWLERHGVPADTAVVSFTAPIAVWARLPGTLNADGTVSLSTYGASPSAKLYDRLKRLALRRVAESGSPDAEIGDFVEDAIDAILYEEEQRAEALAVEKRAAEKAREEEDRRVRDAGIESALRRGKDGAWESISSTLNERVFGWQALRAEVARRNEADRLEGEARTRELVARHGTESQRQRLAEGLLPPEEVSELLADVAFRGLAGEPAYAKIQRAEVTHADDCDCGQDIYDSYRGPADAVSAEVFARVLELRAKLEASLPGLRDALPGAEVAQTIQVHRLWCEGEDCGSVERFGLLVAVSWRGAKVLREFSLDSLDSTKGGAS